MNYSDHVKYLRTFAAAKANASAGPIPFGRVREEYPHARAERLGIVGVAARITSWDGEGAHLAIDCPFCDGSDELVVTEDWAAERVYYSGCMRGRYRVVIEQTTAV